MTTSSEVFLFIRYTFQGAIEISSDLGTHQYMGYTKRQAIAKYKKDYGLRYKHNVVIC